MPRGALPAGGGTDQDVELLRPERSPIARTWVLDEQCAGDDALRAQVEVLLATSAKIGSFLNREQSTDGSFSISLPLVTRLRYGENPHQTAALYGDFDQYFKKVHGKELSFNNILDISAASNLIAEFT